MNSEVKMYGETYLDACTAIYVAAFTAPPMNYHWVTNPKARRYINDLTRTPGFIGYVYEVDGETAAFCLGVLDNYFDGSVYEIREFAVCPKHQRGGTGSAFLRELEIKLAGYDIPAISLSTSRNLPAFEFYLKNGYEEVKENVSLTKWLSQP